MKNVFVTALSGFLVSCVTFPACVSDPCVSVPGETRTDDKTKTYAAGEVFSTLQYFNPSCKSYKNYTVIDSKLNSYKENQIINAVWNETWLVEVCGKRWSVFVHFYGDGEGNTVVGIDGNQIYPIK